MRLFARAMFALGLAAVLAPAWAAHAYAQFGDIKYPAGFTHFDYVNPQAPKGGWSIRITRTMKDIASGKTTKDGFTTVYRPVNKVECKG